VIRAAMEKQGKVALGRVVMHQRERICALEPRDNGILLTTLRTHDEIRETSEVFDRSLPRPSAPMLQIAEKIIEQQDAKFDPSRFTDRYEDALHELIAKKKKGEPVVSSEPEEEDEKVVDLMEALKMSLKGGGGPSREKADRFLEAHGRKAKPKAKGQDEEPPQDRIPQARGLNGYSCRSHATGCGTPSTVTWRKVTP
jgi:DNA end-binding protein Ku